MMHTVHETDRETDSATLSLTGESYLPIDCHTSHLRWFLQRGGLLRR